MAKGHCFSASVYSVAMGDGEREDGGRGRWGGEERFGLNLTSLT